MASADEIGANFSNYVGNAGAVGGNFGVIAIDTQPLSQLAQYTFLYKRDQWQQKQKEADAKVKELADLSDIALNNLRGKDKELLTSRFSKLLQHASDYARKIPKNEQERIQNELEWQTERGAFYNDYNSGKGRAVSYHANVNYAMQNIPNAKERETVLKHIDDTFDNTDITTPISAVPNFKHLTFDIPKHNVQEFNTLAILDNQNVKVKVGVYNPTQNGGIADAAILDIKNAYPEQGSIEYTKLTADQKLEADRQATVPSEAKGWVDATEPLNEALGKYTKDGKFDAASFENDNASNKTLMKAYNGLKRYNKYNRDHYDEAITGVFNDQGVGIPLPPNVIADDFKAGFVDFAKGVNANQLVQSGMFAEYKGDVFTKEATYTGEKNKQKDLSLEWFKAKTGRISATRPYASESGGAKAPDILTQPALIFGEHINRLKTFFNKEEDKDLLIVPFDRTDEITIRALGLKKADKNEKGESVGGYVTYRKDGTALVNSNADGSGGTPLTIEQQKNNFIIAVKGGSKDEAVLDAKFLGDTEAGMNKIFGTSSGTAIWNSWGVTPTAKAAEETNTKSKEPAKKTAVPLTAAQKAFNLKYFGNENGQQK